MVSSRTELSSRNRLVTLNYCRIIRGIQYTAICFCLARLLTACSVQPEPQSQIAVAPAPPPPVATHVIRANPSKTVTASYQGSSTAGHVTAGGEPYNPRALTAASRNLPIGSTVKVTNPQTGRSVKVRINDRGPFVHGRSLDLSKSAAEKLGIAHDGVARVKITPVASPPLSSELEAPPPVIASAPLGAK